MQINLAQSGVEHALPIRNESHVVLQEEERCIQLKMKASLDVLKQSEVTQVVSDHTPSANVEERAVVMAVLTLAPPWEQVRIDSPLKVTLMRKKKMRATLQGLPPLMRDLGQRW